MLFEPIVMRTIIQIHFRLVKLRCSDTIRATSCEILLLIRCHYECIAIVSLSLDYSTVHLNYLHETWPLIHLAKLLLKFVKDR